MGISSNFSTCEVYSGPPNPDPRNFEIVRHEQIGDSLLVEIRYPDCTNYEGRKILVYEDMDIEKLGTKKKIDPHFCEHSDCFSPIARLVPSEIGWIAGTVLCEYLESN